MRQHLRGLRSLNGAFTRRLRPHTIAATPTAASRQMTADFFDNPVDEAPTPVSGPAAWYGADMAKRPDSWTHHLTDGHRAELAAAVARVRDRDILSITEAEFPLPTLGPLLAAIRHETLHGRGFALIRGVPVADYSDREAAVAFWGIGTHLGEAVSQNGKGHVLGHVQDLGYDYSSPQARGYQTSARLPYHTDSSDLVCLLSLQTAKSGGLSSIVSSVTVFNEMLRSDPDLVRLLMRPVYRTRWGEIPEGKKPYSEIPVFNPFKGNVISTYVRSAIRKGQLLDGVPKLTPKHERAFDRIDELANSEALHLDMEFARGDIQILNNHQIMHSRTAYSDHDDLAIRRHLLRLWLACADGPDLPPAMTSAYQGMTESGRPNGIKVPGVPLNAPLTAE